MNKYSLRTATLFVITLFCAVTIMAQTQTTHPQNGKKIIVNDDGTWQYKEDYGTMKDARDGKAYKTVKIGNQIWMAENLNYSTNDSWCYDNNSSNCNTYGRLYTWDAAKRACPSGWHLPSDAEWKTMEMVLGMSQSQANDNDYRGTDEGKKMRSTSRWSYNGNSTNYSGFNALPGGLVEAPCDDFHDCIGWFENLGHLGYWWSSSEGSGAGAWYRHLGCYSGRVGRDSISGKRYGFSTRCLKN